jgi:hypothetical protein
VPSTFETITQSTPKTKYEAHAKTSTKNSANPLRQDYWDADKLLWLEELMIINRSLYDAHIESGDYANGYQWSTGALVRRLKALPEWVGLSEKQAYEALVIGIGKLRLAGCDPSIMVYGEAPCDLLPDNVVRGISGQEDFMQAWPKARASSANLEQAVQYAKDHPVKWPAKFDEALLRYNPTTPIFKLFIDTCLYLQGMVGEEGYILLPQSKLALLIGTKQGGVSTYCQVAKKAGVLAPLNQNLPSLPKEH